MEVDKLISKLGFVAEEVEEEITGYEGQVLFKDLVSMLKKVEKNCQTSINLISEYDKVKSQRQMIS